MGARVVVIEHEAEAGLGYFADWLAGVDVLVVRPYLGEPVPDRAGDGLLVLGGAAAAWEDEQYPWLPATRDLLKAAVEEGVPVLGICLGAQLMTLACGGEVRRGDHGLEIGAGTVRLLPEARDDRLFAGVPEAEPVAVQYHYDVMATPPPGAVPLATGDHYPNQAYRLGGNAWAVQFHPEATPDIFREWTNGLTGHPAGELNSQVDAAGPRLEANWRPLAEAFAAVVTEHAARVRGQTA
ncbi:aminotransferase [Acrocarpospora phusangensis]|uniref:Aminotransferase n=1 Tax=Acrocarpospora phusangensis TaxID=1070424 RepID=A0A919QB36_9ACTN|nr:type 1 glutamine amidotransferase [Acrocarpospora phusangensis]GIH25556.1 aminotransferase [Acrocarpospora phusangensis]